MNGTQLNRNAQNLTGQFLLFSRVLRMTRSARSPMQASAAGAHQSTIRNRSSPTATSVTSTAICSYFFLKMLKFANTLT